MIRTAAAYAVAVAVAYVVASVAATQFVLNELMAIGVPVPFDVRIEVTRTDLFGNLAIYLPVIAIGLSISFIAAGLTARLAPNLRWFVFMVAGATAIAAALVLLEVTQTVPVISGARSALGFAVQCAAGALGGLTFVLLKPTQN
jgi:hypothetical protein